jgi:hypothetical protein
LHASIRPPVGVCSGAPASPIQLIVEFAVDLDVLE